MSFSTRSESPANFCPHRISIALAGLAFLLIGSAGPGRDAFGAEPLPLTESLELWLDASQIQEQRSSAGRPKLNSGDALDRWGDASGHDRDMSSQQPSKSPHLMRLGDSWFLRFDGEDDSLRHRSEPVMLSAASIWMVVAPHRNPGEFRGFFAANAKGERDYQSGVNIDMGPGPSDRFDQLNVEGRGFGGAKNLRLSEDAFGSLAVLELKIDPDQKRVSLFINGAPEGTRPFEPNEFSFQELTLGARHYSNDSKEQVSQGFSAMDVAEVLVYSKPLDEEESKLVLDYLQTKHADLAKVIPANVPRQMTPGIELVKVVNPPPVQMLVPGFEVQEIPVELTNVNNVRFREDGKLVTLGYNGDVHLLSDSDGDGLEDHKHLFYKNEGSLRGPLGIALTPTNYAKGRGLFVPSKGKVSLIVDTDGDDRADDEIVVADGWQEIPQNVDAVGVAIDSDGSLYFGLGTANYANGYLVNDQGIAEYSLESDRGTVQRVSADFSEREIVCTGIRFPIAFAFNQEGDLFCTEQEGATWLANGNPFDELLHVRPQLHYGFPPRHPRHNPGVIDEPSTFDYGPQHQSTCGMVFNEPVNGGPVFGPNWWRGQAIVCGESRGKLWRTKLVNTSAGYVASTQLIGALQMLTVDACVAPNGDLVVACHSGPPDWGTGPTGIGKLFRIRMDRADVARPIAVWAETDREVRVTFDHPLDPLALRDIADRIQIQYGQFVRAGDRFENLVPPYAVVQRQQMSPRWELEVTGVSVSKDLQTLIVHTAEMREAVGYSITLPDASRRAAAPGGGLSEDGGSPVELDLDFQLHGVLVEWEPESESSLDAWRGWIPHLDLDVSRELLSGSSLHQPLWERLAEPGQLKLMTQVDLRSVLRPAVQPGSQLDHQWPAEIAQLRVTGTRPIDLSTSEDSKTEVRNSDEGRSQVLIAPADPEEPIGMSLAISTGRDMPTQLSISVSTNEDESSRPLALRRFFLPWLRFDAQQSGGDIDHPAPIAELAGGSWGRGHRLFHSEQVGCAKCHGGDRLDSSIGPDLGNLIHRDYASVMRDLLDPSYSINPDYLGQVVMLDDGRTLTGVLRTEGGELLLGNDQGETIRVDRQRIEQMHPSSTSVMPKGLLDKLNDSQRRDLMTYLVTSPPRMPRDSPLEAPPVRSSAEVAAALSGAPHNAKPARPLNVVLVDGIKDHGPGEHDYPAWKRAWEQLLIADASLSVSTASDFPTDSQLQVADVIVFFQRGSFSGVRPAKMDQYLKRGGGAVYIHWAVNGDDRSAEFARRIGLSSHSGLIKYRHGPLSLQMHNRDHPILRNFTQLELYDESYWELSGDVDNITLLATSREDDKPTPQIWVTDHEPGRVFVSIPGHYSWTFDDPLFRILLLRGIAWTAKEPVDRFNALATPGARMSR